MLRILLKFNDTVLKVVESDKDQITIGRNIKNDIQIDNLAVSSFHARVERQLGHYFVEDLNSTNGTFVNDKKIGKWGLRDGDAVTIGKHTLVFLLEEGAPGTAGPEMRELDLERTMILDTRRQKELLKQTSGSSEGTGTGKIGILTVLDGGAEFTEYELTDKVTTIGKDPVSGVRLEGLLAPRIAGYITRDRESYFLAPPEKKGKLKVNGRALGETALLKDGDQLEVAGVKMRFHCR